MVHGDADWYDPAPPDPPHSRWGRPLSEWLLELVSDEFPRRNAAGQAVLGIAQPWRSMNPTTPEQIKEFERLVTEADQFPAVLRRAVEAPGFPTARFVRALCEYRVAVQESWERHVKRRTDREERVADRVVERFTANPTAPGADQSFGRRLARVYCGSRDTDHESFKDAHAAAYVLFNALDTAFLADPAALVLVLRQKVLASDAARAIERTGPAGHDAFAPTLLSDLDAASDEQPFKFPAALAAVGREDDELVRGLIRRALSDPWPVALGAIETLGEIGPAVLRHDRGLVDRLLRRPVPVPQHHFPLALSPALGRIGRDDEKLLEILLDYARPRPPRRVPTEFGDWDMTVSERGAALESLANFTHSPGRVVPVLVDALETFEEYDPDWGYELGEHGRVIASLRAFGPAAAPAVRSLARRLKQRGGEWDREAILFLGELGPLAAEALPALEQLRAEDDDPPFTETTPGEEPDKTFDPLDWAIWRVTRA